MGYIFRYYDFLEVGLNFKNISQVILMYSDINSCIFENLFYVSGFVCIVNDFYIFFVRQVYLFLFKYEKCRVFRRLSSCFLLDRY